MVLKSKPSEVWAIRADVGHLVPPALDDDGTDSFLAWPSEEEAKRGLKFQIEYGYIDAGTVERLA